MYCQPNVTSQLLTIMLTSFTALDNYNSTDYLINRHKELTQVDSKAIRTTELCAVSPETAELHNCQVTGILSQMTD